MAGLETLKSYRELYRVLWRPFEREFRTHLFKNATTLFWRGYSLTFLVWAAVTGEVPLCSELRVYYEGGANFIMLCLVAAPVLLVTQLVLALLPKRAKATLRALGRSPFVVGLGYLLGTTALALGYAFAAVGVSLPAELHSEQNMEFWGWILPWMGGFVPVVFAASLAEAYIYQPFLLDLGRTEIAPKPGAPPE